MHLLSQRLITIRLEPSSGPIRAGLGYDERTAAQADDRQDLKEG